VAPIITNLMTLMRVPVTLRSRRCPSSSRCLRTTAYVRHGRSRCRHGHQQGAGCWRVRGEVTL